jgi:hypothetical protein
VLDALKRFNEDVSEVRTGFEFGVSFVNFQDLAEGDIVGRAMFMKAIKTSLQVSSPTPGSAAPICLAVGLAGSMTAPNFLSMPMSIAPSARSQVASMPK